MVIVTAAMEVVAVAMVAVRMEVAVTTEVAVIGTDREVEGVTLVSRSPTRIWTLLRISSE